CNIDNNTFDNVSNAVYLDACSNITVEQNNIYHGHGSRADISIMHTASNVQIINNTLAMLPGASATDKTQKLYGIMAQGTAGGLNNLTISNNTIDGGCVNSGIALVGPGNTFTVSNNTFKNIGTDTLFSTATPGYGAIAVSNLSGQITS